MSTNSRPRRLWAVVATVAVVGVAATLTAVSIASPDSPSSSSPPSQTAAARPDVAALAGPLADQELNWEECTWGKEAFAAPLEEADVSNVECATINVPQDWHNPDPDRTWDVRMSMARNIDSAAPDYRSSPEMAQAAPLAWTTMGTNNAFATAALYPDAGHLVRLLIAEGESATRPVVPLEAVGRIIDEMPGLDDTRRAGARAALEQSAALTEQPPADTPETVRATSDELIEFTRCTDGEWTQGLEYWLQFNQKTTLEAPLSAQFGLLSAPLACAFWPTESAMPELDDRFPETIVLQSELDSMTPFEQGRASGLGLPNTSLLGGDRPPTSA